MSFFFGKKSESDNQVGFQSNGPCSFKRPFQVPEIYDVPNESEIVFVRLLRGCDLRASRPLLGYSNPFVEMKLLPPDENLGDEISISSYKPHTLNPIWKIPETFRFIISNPTNTKILFSV